MQLVEETQQQETLPSGDDVEIRQVRQVQEVVKRVAVVKKGRGRAAARAEEGEPEAEGQEEEDMEAAAAAGRLRRGGAGRADTDARLEEELGQAMREDLGEAGSSMRAPQGANVRRYEQVTVEEGVRAADGGEEEGGDDEGIAAEEPPAEMHRAGRGRKGGAAGGRKGKGKAQAASPTEIPETQALEEPEVPESWVAATRDALDEGARDEEQVSSVRVCLHASHSQERISARRLLPSCFGEIGGRRVLSFCWGVSHAGRLFHPGGCCRPCFH